MTKNEAKNKIAALKAANASKMARINALCAEVKQLRAEIEGNERLIEEYEEAGE